MPLLDGIAYREIYPGIDVVYRGSGSDLKSEYIVAPGHDPSRIRLRYAGADQLRIEPDGSLTIGIGPHTLRSRRRSSTRSGATGERASRGGSE